MSLNSKRLIFFSLLVLFLGYTAMIATVGTSAGVAGNMSAEAARGKELYQKFNCTACHQIYGLGGYMGPDLTNVISQKGKGVEYVKAIMKTGTAKMPNFKLSDTEVNDLAAFLEYLNKTGVSLPKDYKLNLDGTVGSKDDKE